MHTHTHTTHIHIPHTNTPHVHTAYTHMYTPHTHHVYPHMHTHAYTTYVHTWDDYGGELTAVVQTGGQETLGQCS